MRFYTRFQTLVIILVSLTFITINTVLGQDDDSTSSAPFGRIEISSYTILNGDGRDVDTIGFWIAPDPLNSLMFVSAKGNDIVEIWQYPFNSDSTYAELNENNSDGCLGGDRVNGVAVNQEQNLLYIAVSEPDNNICIFEIDGFNVQFLEQVDVDYNLGSEPNLALLHHLDGQVYLYLSADDVIYIYNTETMTEIGDFDITSVDEIEVIFADDFYQYLYIPDENDHTGVYVYSVADDGLMQNDDIANFGADDIFEADAEGVLIYHCMSEGIDNGKGWIVVSDQRDELTDFEFFDRVTLEHLGTINIETVNNTDGIASTQIALPDYNLGIFAVIDDDQQTVLVGWKSILEATGLHCDE